MPLLYLIADFMFILLYHVIKYRRKVVIENLTNSFPEKSLDEIRKIEHSFYIYFADLMVETIKMLSVSAEKIIKRYTLTNKELIDDLENRNQSYLIAVGHYGNWEWNTIAIPKFLKAQPMIIYKPLNNLVFDEVFKKAREKSGTLMIRMKLVLREIVKQKNELTATVFAADQTPAKADHKDRIEFLNQSTEVFLGLEKIAKSTNYPVVFCDIQVIKRGYYACDFKLICNDPSQTEYLDITKKYAELLEQRINTAPPYWLWSHKRWKRKHKNSNQNE